MQGKVLTPAGSLSGGRTNKRTAASLNFARQSVTCVWDFAADGGAVGTYLFNTKLPPNAVVTSVHADELTPVTGATSITLSAGATALTGATDFTGISGVGTVALAGSATAIKLSTTASSELQIAIATNPATAGRIRFAISWYLSAP